MINSAPVNNIKRTSAIFLIVMAVVFYFLEGILFNPLILWTTLPLYMSYAIINSAVKTNSAKKLFAGYGFIFVSVGFSLFYHVAWYFDWQGTKTSSSTSALIFIWLPIYAVIVGLIGYVVGILVGMVYEQKA